jgi:predicted rRNA methylase YqxC with S4 and FtsJ domains
LISRNIIDRINEIHLGGSIDNNIHIDLEHGFYEQKFVSDIFIKLDSFLKNNQINNQERENLDTGS